ncbi:unnamed protein product [Cuscuta campestris]|uniref:CCHC-type domain-containing protein n=1 Tax=Cuscuta campestris TaxID=132261 RepID=A0A484KAD2_9ASTE|nr:unnamed protein product [Cuscuta campestris]
MWDHIEEKFFTAMNKEGSYCTRDQLTSKWSHINRKVRQFIRVYEECSRSWRSGTNDADALWLATTRYQDDGHQGKVPIDLWRILSCSPKWQQLNNPNGGSSKKRSSVDAKVEVDETIGSSDQIPPFNIADSDDEDPIPRPIGRKKAKSIASGSGGSGSASVSSRDEIGQAMVEQLRVSNLREEERLKLKEKELKRKEQDDEIKIMETDLSTLSEAREMGILRMLEMIKTKLMERLAKKSENLRDDVCPKIRAKLKGKIEHAHMFTSHFSGGSKKGGEEIETLMKKKRTKQGILKEALRKHIPKAAPCQGKEKTTTQVAKTGGKTKGKNPSQELVNIRMKNGTSVTEHINKLNSILARLLSVDIKFEDEVQALLLLSSLPDSWSGTVIAVTSSAGPDGFTFEKIRDLVLGEDVRRRSSSESSEESLNIVRGRGNNRGSGSKNRRRSQSKTWDSSGVTCCKCKEVGHFKNQCPKEDKQVNIVRGSASDEDLFICCVESSVASWVMDSGASFHATHSGEALQNLVVGDFGNVRLADDRALDVTSMGDIVLKTPIGFWTLKNVRVVPTLKKSLILVRQLDEQGHEGVTVPVKKRNKVWFTESRGQNKVVYAREKPRATGRTQDERARKGSRRPVRGIYGSGSSRGASAKFPRRQWVRRTSILTVGTSLKNFLLSMESVCSQDVPGSGSVRLQWESVGTEDESGADLAMTDVLELGRASTGLSVA